MPSAIETSPAAPPPVQCVVAIPANDEADLLPGCLAALAVQRDRFGSPVPGGVFAVVVLANNCTDATVETARHLSARLPFALHVIDVELPPETASAGGARKAAMDEAALLLAAGGGNGAILTTDADTTVASTWLSANLEALASGADAVAGYVDPDPMDYLALGPAFMARGRLEDTYLRLSNEIWARLDPIAHDPWPNHRIDAGASLAVSLQAYLDVGGVPLLPVGEDAALVRLLERAGKKVRHSLDVRVTTSCRLEGRAQGGAAATMKARFEDAEAECDRDMEPAMAVARRALCKGRLRRWHDRRESRADCPLALAGDHDRPAGVSPARRMPFVDLWDEVEASDRRLRRGPPLRPRDLPRQIEIARRLLVKLTARRRRASSRPADTADAVTWIEPELSDAWPR